MSAALYWRPQRFFSHLAGLHRQSRANELLHNTGLTLVIAANYGGRWDIAQAARRLAEDVAAGRCNR
jgi:undecaprenyl diphosphate synthase